MSTMSIAAVDYADHITLNEVYFTLCQAINLDGLVLAQ